LAETTSDLGDWNPHAPIHGGYNSCDNCHAKDKEITNNYCEKCHTYKPGAPTA
ncbi:MAG: cytochrome c3 family protein, partial [Raoultibacter sp.]